jgi:hypothetical protein
MYRILFMLNEYNAIHRMPLHIRLSTTCILDEEISELIENTSHARTAFGCFQVTKLCQCTICIIYMWGPGARASTAT